jgi:arabinogalactan endo-1,4-beta-galactosidase
MPKNNLRLWIFILPLITAVSCKKAAPTDRAVDVTPTPVVTSNFAKGADIGWLTQMESSGRKFYNSSNAETECLQLLKSVGMNAIRLRVWVNPTGGWNSSADVVAKATRAKNLGLKILIDFHYSDSWADPGQQTKPAAWSTLTLAGLQTSITQHTTAVLTDLKNAGITPDWVQVGNETNNGMLWPEGKASTNMANFASMINAGYNAVKAVNSNIKVIVHLSNGYDNALFRWMFDGLKNNGANWDVIGVSLYPDVSTWSTLNTQCLANMNDMVTRYNKEVMVAEVGMSWDQAAACNAFLADIIAKTKSIANDKGLGVFYWEPEAYNNWQGYTKGAFDNSGKPTIALNAFN